MSFSEWVAEQRAGAQRRQQIADERRRLNNEAREARIREKNAKTEARRANGGAGVSIKFYNLDDRRKCGRR